MILECAEMLNYCSAEKISWFVGGVRCLQRGVLIIFSNWSLQSGFQAPEVQRHLASLPQHSLHTYNPDGQQHYS